jgi:hypothetical protein
MSTEIRIPIRVDDAAAEAAWEDFRQRTTAGANQLEATLGGGTTKALRELAQEAKRAGVEVEDLSGFVEGLARARCSRS